MAKTKLVILGNCQAQMMEGLFTRANPELEIIRLPPNFELQERDREKILASLADADHIFSQRVSEDYQLEWLRKSWQTANFPGKVTVWPVIYFDGYFPDVQYMYQPKYGKLTGPLEDYHLMKVFNAYKTGLPAEAAVERITTQASQEDAGSFEASLGRLTSREQDADVKISDFLATEVAKRRAFYTPNHPYNFVVIEMARRLAAHVNIGFDTARAEQGGYRLDKIYIPAYPVIRQAQGLGFDETVVYKGLQVGAVTESSVELGPQKHYTSAELVAEYYRIYDVVFAKKT